MTPTSKPKSSQPLEKSRTAAQSPNASPTEIVIVTASTAILTDLPSRPAARSPATAVRGRLFHPRRENTAAVGEKGKAKVKSVLAVMSRRQSLRWLASGCRCHIRRLARRTAKRPS